MMKIIKYPSRESWNRLCQRPVLEMDKITPKVAAILEEVRQEGDKALVRLTGKFDKIKLAELSIPVLSSSDLSKDLKEAIRLAKSNIESFHNAQSEEVQRIETQPGVVCWRKSIPIQKVGLYIPGGSAPLFSTLLMLGIPAKLAGCQEIVVCTPPNRDGSVHPAILYTAHLIGIKKIYLVGGAQAIGAMAYGTASIPKVNKIFGPGNQYVTMAKQLVQKGSVAIDMPAGPSEVLVIADASCEPSFVAADLLSQAEHGPDSQVVLVSNEEKVVEAILTELFEQLNLLPRKEIALQALDNSLVLLVKDLEEAIDFSS